MKQDLITRLPAEKPKQGEEAAGNFADGRLCHVGSPCCMWTAMQEVLLQLSEEQLFLRQSRDLSSQIIIFTHQVPVKRFGVSVECRAWAELHLAKHSPLPFLFVLILWI